ncbi:MAG TPA: hypothetical protein VLA00_15125 [Xanthobacteraceae bacterium]|nr:hypothetical protein [Xanthobacteraceae bacterium]
MNRTTRLSGWLVAALMLPAAALADSKPAPRPPIDAAADPLCRSMGPGFRRIEGTQSCVKISGAMQVDSYAGRAAPVDALAPALRAR